jgi:hypothetical protein
MTALSWDDVGQKAYENGVDHGVLYIPDDSGAYVDGVAWNGLTTVTEAPTGAAPNPQYADNIKYLNLFSAEELGATIDAFTYPDEFQQFDGLSVPIAGLAIGQQNRKTFGLCYRSKIGNDLDGDDFGFKLHLMYGCTASPSQKAYTSVNDKPEGMAFSWAITTVPVSVSGLKPTSLVTLDSTKVDSDTLTDLMTMLYGTTGVDPSLPLPDAIVTMFSGTVTSVVPLFPTYVEGTHTITIVATTGVNYYIEGVLKAAGAHVIAVDSMVTARPAPGYILTPDHQDEWFFAF